MLDYSKILQEIKPSDSEQKYLLEESNKLISSLNKQLKGARACLGGSLAKNTNIKGDFEVDIFVAFSYSKHKDKDISKELAKTLKKYRPKKIHGSRDYFQIKQKNINFEIVPILDLKDIKKSQNTTDLSPFHVAWVKNKAKKDLVDQIRLAKHFAYSNNIYGAESHIGGFSGYLLEVLVIHYKGFENFLKATSKWKQKEVLDPSKRYKSIKYAYEKLNFSKKASPLVVIDPIDKTRNIAAALSKEKYLEFIALAKKYLQKKDNSFFVKKSFSLKHLKDHIILVAVPIEGKDDVAGSKIKKIKEYLASKLSENDFVLKDSIFYFGRPSYIAFKIKKEPLPKIKKHYGPPKHLQIHLQAFQKKFGVEIFFEKNKSYVLVKRKYLYAKDLIQDLITKDNYIKDKVKEIGFLS